MKPGVFLLNIAIIAGLLIFGQWQLALGWFIGTYLIMGGTIAATIIRDTPGALHRPTHRSVE